MLPLHLAALSGFSDCCRKLLSSGKSLAHTISCQRTHLLDIQIDADCIFCTGFVIDTPDDFGRTCLHAAAAGGCVFLLTVGSLGGFVFPVHVFFCVCVCVLKLYVFEFAVSCNHRLFKQKPGVSEPAVEHRSRLQQEGQLWQVNSSRAATNEYFSH